MNSAVKSGLSLILALLALAAAGCGDDDGSDDDGGDTSDGRQVSVGQVAGGDLFVGVVLEGADVRAYVCDGTSIAEWLTGSTSGDQIDAASSFGTALQARRLDGGVMGTITLADGRQLDITTERATGTAGLFRTEVTIDGVQYVSGWVVLASGEQRGGLSYGCISCPLPPPPVGGSEYALGGAGGYYGFYAFYNISLFRF